MKERPILFSGAMVRAILDGTKTQTRRVIVPTMTPPRIAPLHMEPWEIDGYPQTDDDRRRCWVGTHPDYATGDKWFTCPYGAPADPDVGKMEPDRLWVRETWKEWPNTAGPEWRGPADMGAIYKATWDKSGGHGWKPSIHMPRAYSRIALEVTDVRVQRVQDISEADAIAEGIDRAEYGEPVAGFQVLWDSINAKRGYGWESNPWVWAVSFVRVPPCS